MKIDENMMMEVRDLRENVDEDRWYWWRFDLHWHISRKEKWKHRFERNHRIHRRLKDQAENERRRRRRIMMRSFSNEYQRTRFSKNNRRCAMFVDETQRESNSW